MMLPVVVDLQRLRRRLAVEGRDRLRDLRRLEDRLRQFEDIEPLYCLRHSRWAMLMLMR